MRSYILCVCNKEFQMTNKIYSEEDDIKELHRLISSHYKENIQYIYKVICKLISYLTEDSRFNHHYNKYLIVVSCLERCYHWHPHHKEIIHSYHSYISEELHRLKSEEYEKRTKERRHSSFCRYCVIS
jgi:hypothetical protein